MADKIDDEVVGKRVIDASYAIVLDTPRTFVEDIYVSGLIRSTATPQTLTGAGAVNVTTPVTLLVTTAANDLTLADGFEGQRKTIIMKTDGGTGTLTPTNLTAGTTITFDDAGDTAHLLFIDGGRNFIAGSATLG